MLTAKKNWKFLPPPSLLAINQLQEELKTTKNPYFFLGNFSSRIAAL
jgi:hypothetical protein